jgi:16S rRNA (guanine966-N2)-methyltransferase
MRIITGRYKGATLRTVKGDNVRPTQDRVREALFSILGQHVQGAAVLDLFAGSGGLGLEALSRGAVSATFVERNRVVANVLQQNIDRIGAANCTVVVQTADRAISRLASAGQKFDLVFLDPPYGKGLVPIAIQQLARHELVRLEGRIVAEHEQRYTPPGEMPPFFCIDTRRYGDTAFSIFSPLVLEEV